ncbi:N-acetylmuramoyl-L-alanine amidase family protein [Sediminitomix flava]|uniref:N-acetylmuramoyl-L-alanine amidase n=1 Tax=Sediminitomix flava TaxID=379075 RepID=A0A315ZA94_SEDFL|nr:N-acetylmuramoyl-L-alanine amidase [Sediminitomix flava]PWJ41983.1 N-acetylmuramoyl-L-alanine amidase [Sediminitomix flava]
MKKSLFIYFLLLPFILKAQSVSNLIQHYQERAQTYLVKSNELRQYFSINTDGIHMYASPEMKQLNKAEFTVFWEDLEQFKALLKYTDRAYQIEFYENHGTNRFSDDVASTIEILKQNYRYYHQPSNNPLAGIKVAIDPGHIAGDFKTAQVEGRYINMKHGGKEYQFWEAELNLATAKVLKDSLSKYGAEVYLTREIPNTSAEGFTYEDWKKSHLRKKMQADGLSSPQIDKKIKISYPSQIYREYFLRGDLEARANNINYFNPDVVVVIHYNADEKNQGWSKPSQRNFGMVFVPGSYLKKELETPRDRYDFLRNLVSDHTQESAKLSKHIMENLEEHIQVPAVDDTTEPNYLKSVAIRLSPGVYARNLRLCRLLNAPLCYGEPLLQDNEKELEALSKIDLSKGIIPNRIVEVANSYFFGILKYIEEK